MAQLSPDESDIIKHHPLKNALDPALHDLLEEAERFHLRSISYDGAASDTDQFYRNTIFKLLSALMGEDMALNIRSRIRNGNAASDLANLAARLLQPDFSFSYSHYRPLVHLVIQRPPPTESRDVRDTWNFNVWNAVLSLIDTVSRVTTPPRRIPLSSIQQTPWLHNTSSFSNSTEHQKYVDRVLKEELGEIQVDLPRFFDAYFGDIPPLTTVSQAVLEECKKGDSPLYSTEEGWRGWPELAAETDVLRWLANIITELVQVAESQNPSLKIDRRPLAQPSKPLQESVAQRKLDIGFVNDLTATEDSRCRWSQILVPGELKNDTRYDTKSQAWFDIGKYAREVFAAQDTRRFVLGFTLCGPFLRLWNFDRLGATASKKFNINQDGLQFVSVVLGFLLMSREQLGFDPTIVATGTERYIEIEKNGTKERLIIDGIIGRARCVAGRATTCWKAYCETDTSRRPLVVKDSWQYLECTEEGELLREATAKAVKNVARYYHHEIVRIDNKDDDILAIRKGLSIPISNDDKGDFEAIARRTRSQRGRMSQGRTAGQKRKRSSTKSAGSPAPLNRVHRRVVVRDYGKPIYESSSKATLLTGLAGCIEGYMSLYDKTDLIQSDISPRNLMVNEDNDNPSWPAFLIDLDLAIKEKRDASSGARGKTGTRAFMAIGVLYGEQHCFMHDLESFFWVLFWICIHYEGPGKGSTVERFEKWNYMDTEELAGAKHGVIGEEGDFLRVANGYVTPYYQSLIPCLDQLRRLVFPNGGRWKISNPNLSKEMVETLQNAQYNLDAVNQ
ncbi:hypothetical protein AJ78_08541 [Emergomyces pasteurianus Ep9510]|uniref:Fungal-type protein kinase domain-containing protein n=1 Tax=Emergomyces pasteurianus Ep9510 TaxID=1447872 RepID=A0A1J9P271_9EURO|nr:hypothetical protein AJ78_08541 [Emergomyces pasteurianus Ep9510]